MVNVNMRVMDLAGSWMESTKMIGVDLSHSLLSGGVLNGADLSGANLKHADLRGGWFNLITLKGANMEDANLSGSLFLGADMTGANLRGASLAGATLIGASLRGADLRGADLTSAELVFQQPLVDAIRKNDAFLQQMSSTQWEKLNIGDAVLDGVKYDSQTVWPQGFEIPLTAVFQPINLAESQPTDADSLSTNQSQPGAEKKITISGSTTVSKIANTLARAYMAAYPGVYLRIFSSNSTNGILDAGSASVDIGMSSRLPSTEELAKYPGMKTVPIAREGIVVVTNLNNPVTQISLQELRAVFAGRIRNWKELGGPDAEIKLVQQKTSMIETFNLQVMQGEATNPELIETLPSDAAVRARVSTDADVLGLLPFRMTGNSVRRLTLNGVVPQHSTFASGEYPFIQNFYLILVGSSLPEIEGWLKFIASDRGREIITAEGLETVNNGKP